MHFQLQLWSTFCGDKVILRCWDRLESNAEAVEEISRTVQRSFSDDQRPAARGAHDAGEYSPELVHVRADPRHVRRASPKALRRCCRAGLVATLLLSALLQRHQHQHLMWNVFSRDVGYVPMVRKNDDLAVACKVGEGFEHGPRSVLVRCHENIVKDDR